MKMCFALARTVAAASALALVSLASAPKPPAEAKRKVDFAATAAAPTFSGPAGVIVKVTTASIAADGTITARVKLTDRVGAPLDRLGVSTPGAVSLSFIAAYIPTGQKQYVAYTTTTLKATINSNPAQVQAGTDSGGTWTTNAIGDYTYTFKTKAPATFDKTATHSIGVTASRNMAEFFDYTTWTQVSNDVYNFVPAGGTPTNLRQIVVTESCNQCHNDLFAHGGSRIKVEVCILCHTPQTINPDTLLTQDMPVLIHKIHQGKNLPSVLAGTPYRIWHRGAWSDFSDVAYPQDTRNCQSCHTSAAAQKDNWKTNPSRAACGACHDDVNFQTGANHVNLPQFDDTQCAFCHSNPTTQDFDASVTGAHVVPNYSATLPGIVMKVLGVSNTAPGQKLTVNFTMADKQGNAVDPRKITQFRVVLGGPNVDYQVGAGGARISETVSPTSTALTGSGGTYSYTMTNVIPTAAAGSYTVMLMATNNVTLLPGTVKQTAAVDLAQPVIYYFSVDQSPVVARRVVVSTDKCAACHGDLKFVHGGNRNDTQACVICHNPTLIDGTSKQTVNFAYQIHATHRGEALANPYPIAGTNYQEVLFPGDLRDCTTCHVGTTYRPDTIGAKADVVSTGNFTATMKPIAAACQGCHDDIDTASHALANTTALGETCNVCHGVNGAFSVDKVHKRIQ